jgi:hypothetical protein
MFSGISARWSDASACRGGGGATVDLAGIGEVVGAEGVLLEVQSLIEQLLDLGEPFGVGLGDWQCRAPLDAERFECFGIGVLAGLVPDDQVGVGRAVLLSSIA